MPSTEPETVTRAKAGAEPWPEMSAPPNPEPLPDWDLALLEISLGTSLHRFWSPVLRRGSVLLYLCRENQTQS